MPNIQARLEALEAETTLIRKLKSGSITAFEELFNAYYKALTAYAKTILKNSDDAEDTVQQIFVSFWEKRATLEVQTSFRALLYKSVHNACLNKIKQQQVRTEYANELKLHSSEIATDENLDQKELQIKIENAIQTLPEQCAKIFKMSRFEQLKYLEIADQLGLSVKTVENQMGKALKIMREQLKDYLPILVFILASTN